MNICLQLIRCRYNLFLYTIIWCTIKFVMLHNLPIIDLIFIHLSQHSKEFKMFFKFLNIILLKCSFFNYLYIKSSDLYAFLAELMHAISKNSNLSLSSSWFVNSTVRWSRYELINFLSRHFFTPAKSHWHSVWMYAFFWYLSSKRSLTIFSLNEWNENAWYCRPRRSLSRWELFTLWGGPNIKANRSRGIRCDHRSSLRPIGPFISSNGPADALLKNKRLVSPLTPYNIIWIVRPCRNFDFTGYTSQHISDTSQRYD